MEYSSILRYHGAVRFIFAKFYAYFMLLKLSLILSKYYMSNSKIFPNLMWRNHVTVMIGCRLFSPTSTADS